MAARGASAGGGKLGGAAIAIGASKVNRGAYELLAVAHHLRTTHANHCAHLLPSGGAAVETRQAACVAIALMLGYSQPASLVDITYSATRAISSSERRLPKAGIAPLPFVTCLATASGLKPPSRYFSSASFFKVLSDTVRNTKKQNMSIENPVKMTVKSKKESAH